MKQTDSELALSVAKKSMKIVIFIGMFAVVLLMINIYVMMTQITASAQLSRKLYVLEQALAQDEEGKPVEQAKGESVSESVKK